MAANAKVLLESEERGERQLFINQDFFVGYRRTVIQSDEILKGIWIPLSSKHMLFRAFKQSQRREDDIAIVTGAFMVSFQENDFVKMGFKPKIEKIRMAYGGMAPTTKFAIETIKGLKGREWNNELLEEISTRLINEFLLPPDVMGGQPQYRIALTLGFFHKFYIYVNQQLNHQAKYFKVQIEEPHLLPFSSTQIFSVIL